MQATPSTFTFKQLVPSTVRVVGQIHPQTTALSVLSPVQHALSHPTLVLLVLVGITY